MKKVELKNNEDQNLSWWSINTQQLGNSVDGSRSDTKDYCKSPACYLAEVNFLSLLIYLNKNRNIKPQVEKVKLKSHDCCQQIEASALYKDLVMPNKNTQFGERTYLVLSGKQAGTVAELNGYGKMQKMLASAVGQIPNFQPPTTPTIYAIRPLVERSTIISEITDILRNLPKNQILTKQLLKEARYLTIKNGGYLPALFYLLDQIGIEADTTEIQSNSDTINKLLSPKTSDVLLIKTFFFFGKFLP